MRKLDLYNQLKQEQYKADIEALKWRIWAIKEKTDGQLREDYNKIAERDESEAMGIFKACNAIRGDYTGKLNDESVALLDKYIEMRSQYRKLKAEVK